eukprot:TRINITY_DN5670_c0_g1_i1.p1 TRINITY_DN5670_c0_g1~~TRINITY_DN5670_c0_g1_i1.p1  ORF type:complete len:179 (-),score=14.74 TRINITY_DN5670_c0_g1_i1:384-920(-)
MSRTLILALLVVGCFALSASAQCASPTMKCDFYFNGSDTTVPTFTLQTTRDEKVVSTALRWKGPNEYVETASTLGNQTCVVVGKKNVFCDNYFFFRPRGGKKSYQKFVNRADRLGVRPIPKWKLQQLNGACIKLGIDSVKLKLTKGRAANNSVWLNPRDGNPKFPEGRRCVVFRIKAV